MKTFPIAWEIINLQITLNMVKNFQYVWFFNLLYDDFEVLLLWPFCLRNCALVSKISRSSERKKQKKELRNLGQWWYQFSSVQFISVAQLCLTISNPMNRRKPGLPVHHQLPESTQTHVHWVGDAIQPSHPLSFPSPPSLNLSQHQGLFKWVSSQHQVAKVLEFQLQHQSFQWTPRTDLL